MKHQIPSPTALSKALIELLPSLQDDWRKIRQYKVPYCMLAGSKILRDGRLLPAVLPDR